MKAVLGEWVLLHQVQHHQRRNALRIRTDFVHVPSAVVGPDRRHPLWLELLQVGGGHRATLLARNGQNRLGCLALVVTVTSFVGDQLQRRREIRIAEHLSRSRRTRAIDQIGLARVRVGTVHLHGVGPATSDVLRERKAVLGVVDCGRQELGERLGPKLLAHRIPSRDDARDGHRIDAALRHLFDAFGGKRVDRKTTRCPAARVEAMHGPRLGIVIDDEQVTANTIAGRLHQSNRGVGGDGRIDRVAAALEDLHTRTSGEWLARRDDAEGGRDDRSTDDGSR